MKETEHSGSERAVYNDKDPYWNQSAGKHKAPQLFKCMQKYL